MTPVSTARGLLDRADLEVHDSITEDGQARYLVTQWYLNGELVRQDALVNLLRGQDLGVTANG